MSLDSSLDGVLSLLDLEPLEQNLFRGISPKERLQRVFGGQVIGQALVAAQRTVPDDRLCHSLHCYFLRPGDTQVPIIYEVDRIRDGKSFTTRRVVAIQNGKAIFSLSASFQVIEKGLEHEVKMPDVPGPDGLMSEQERREAFKDQIPEKFREMWLRPRPIETRPVNPRDMFKPQPTEPEQYIWVRTNGSLPNDMALQQAMLAYASDMSLLDTCTLPHGIAWGDPGVQMASLDHAMWFHREFRMDEWLLYAQDSPTSAGSRGINRGVFYRQDGTIVATVAQEGLIRIHEEEFNKGA